MLNNNALNRTRRKKRCFPVSSVVERPLLAVLRHGRCRPKADCG
ncbi:MAG: hypothetical protein ABUK13_09480 [Gammaproteobacteria bacterium]